MRSSIPWVVVETTHGYGVRRTTSPDRGQWSRTMIHQLTDEYDLVAPLYGCGEAELGSRAAANHRFVGRWVVATRGIAVAAVMAWVRPDNRVFLSFVGDADVRGRLARAAATDLVSCPSTAARCSRPRCCVGPSMPQQHGATQPSPPRRASRIEPSTRASDASGPTGPAGFSRWCCREPQ